MSDIYYLGKNNEHYRSLYLAMCNEGFSVTMLDVDQMGLTPSSRLSKYKKKIFGGTSNVMKATWYDQLKVSAKPIILAYWGTNVIPDIISIKKCIPNSRIVLNVLCHPLGINHRSVTLQNHYMKYAMKYVDGIIFSSSVMKEYLVEKVFTEGKYKPNIIIPPLLSKNELPEINNVPLYVHPNVIFMGRPDYRKGQPTDNVVKFLQEACSEGVIVHYASGNDVECMSLDNENAKSYPYMSLGNLLKYANRFDASLIVYNLDACTIDVRFRLTIPDRLVASVAAGVPVAIPSKGYDACREYLGYYEKSFLEFDNYADLYAKLANRERVAFMRENAVTATRESYYFERYINQLMKFLRQL